MRFRVLAFCALLVLLESAFGAPATRFHSFAQIGDGGGLRSTILLLNQGGEAIQATVSFTTQQGSSLELSVNGQTVSSLPVEVPANGAVKLVTSGTGNTTKVGWVKIEADGEIGAQVFFEIFQQGQLVTQASIGSNSGVKRASLFVNQGNGTRTGVAIANESEGRIAIQVSLSNATGGDLGEKVLNIEPSNQVALFVDELFPGVVVSQGRLKLNSSGPISVTTLQQTGLVLGTLPPVQGF